MSEIKKKAHTRLNLNFCATDSNEVDERKRRKRKPQCTSCTGIRDFGYACIFPF